MRIDLARAADQTVDELEQVLSLDIPDEERALELADRVGRLRARQFKTLVRSILVVRQTLTPKQMRTLTAGAAH